MVIVAVPFDAVVHACGEAIRVSILEVDWFRIGRTLVRWPGMGAAAREFPDLNAAAHAIRDRLERRAAAGEAVPRDLAARFMVCILRPPLQERVGTHDGTFILDGTARPYRFSPELVAARVHVMLESSAETDWLPLAALKPWVSERAARELGDDGALVAALDERLRKVAPRRPRAAVPPCRAPRAARRAPARARARLTPHAPPARSRRLALTR
jgi:hypothetical protein